MIVVGDIFQDVARVFGTSTRSVVMNRLNTAVELLANEGHWNPNIGLMDITTDEKTIALPSDVDMPLGLNIGGYPAEFRNKWFEFHLNGPGSECCRSSCSFKWEDQMFLPTYRRITKPSEISFTSSDPLDVGNIITVYGMDANNLKLVHVDPTTGLTVDGVEFAITASVSFNGVFVQNVYRISKPVTGGFVTATIREQGETDTIGVGIFDPNVKEPAFRRISISGACGVPNCAPCQVFNALDPHQRWVRMRYRRKTQQLVYDTDVIFLHSKQAVLMAVKAVKKFDDDLAEGGDQYMEKAVEFLSKRQRVENGPNTIIPQMQMRASAASGFRNMV